MRLAAQKLIALSLAVFLSGACCLFCSVIPVIATVHCPLEKFGHCNKKSGELSSTPSIAADDQGNIRCPFLSKRSDLAQKPTFDDGAAAVKTAGVSSLSPFLAAKNYTSPHLFRSVIRDRGGTYLNNCVFRI